MKNPDGNQSQQVPSPPAYTPVAGQPSQPPSPAQQPTSALVGELFGRGLNAGLKAAKSAAVVGKNIISAASKSSDPAPSPPVAPVQRPVGSQHPQSQQVQQPSYPPSQPVMYQAPVVYQTQNAFVPQPGSPQVYPMMGQPQMYPSSNNQQPYPNKQPYRPPQRPPYPSTTFWAPIYRSSAWKALLYYILINPVLGFLTFGYTLATMITGLVLLVIYPIGLPLLYLFTITWRSLRKIEMHILDWVIGIPFQDTTIWIESRQSTDNPFEFMGNLVWTHSTWDIVLTNIFLKPVRVVINLLVAVVTVALGIPFVWCLPTLLQILEDAADGERMGSNSDLSSSLCCCCCCDTDLGPDVEMGQESNRDESCCTFLICTICCLGCCRPSRHRRRRYGP